MSGRLSGDRGATIIETAIVAPVLFLLMFTLVDLGLVVIGNSVGSNAARDGARVGIIQYLGADGAGQNRTDIETAVKQRLVGLVRGTPTIAVRCIDGDSTGANPPLKPCNSSIEVDRDLIEVKVTWKHVGATPFVANSTHVETARLVIVGDVDLTAGPTPPLLVSVGNATVVEGNPGDSRDLVFTVTRSHNLSNVTVQYTTANGDAPAATAGSDFTAASGTLTFPSGGALTQTVTVHVTSELVVENDEFLKLILSSPTSSSGPIQLGNATGIGTITNDDVDTTPPVLNRVEIFDNDHDGKLDFAVAYFDTDTPLRANCPGTWTFSDSTGASVQTTAVNGSTVQIFLNEGTTGYNTGPNVTVSGSGTCDLNGNAAGSGSGPVVDLAQPVPVGLSSTNAGTAAQAGRAQPGDTVSFVFSEALSGLPGSASFVITGGTGNGANSGDSYSVGGLFGTAALGRSDYVTTNNSTATWANSTIQVVGTSVRVTLGPACAGSGCSGTTANSAAAGTGTVVVTPSNTLHDAANNAVTGTNSTVIKLF